MIPVALNPAHLRIGLAGEGPLAQRRFSALTAAGASPARLGGTPDDGALGGLAVLYIVGLPADTAEALAIRARALRVLVNVEDVPEFCDFHSVSEIRRGDLLLTVSTNGAAPGLAAAIRRRLGACFGPEWAGRVRDVAGLRAAWRAEGLGMAETAERIEEMAATRGWFSFLKPPP